MKYELFYVFQLMILFLIKIKSNKKQMNISNKQLHYSNNLKLLSFSPNDNFYSKHYNRNTPSSTSRKLYQVYKQNNRQNQNSSKFSTTRMANPENSTKEQHNKKISHKLGNSNHDVVKQQMRRVKAYSTNVIKNQNEFITQGNRPQANITAYHPHNLTCKTINNSQLSYHQYINHKHTYKQLIQSRIQNEKDLTLLTRTFCSQRKQEHKAKMELVNMLEKRIERQNKQREKAQLTRRQNDYLQKQRNQNNTKKYINHLMKYHAKKSLLEKNNQTAYQIRQRSQSASSIKSIKSKLSSRQKQQRSKQLREQNQQKISRAKSRSMNRINQKSKSMREDMARVYECKSGIEGWRIGEGELRAKQIAATIENSRRNKETLTRLIASSRGKSSHEIIGELNKTLQSVRI